MLKLYYARGTCALASLIALESICDPYLFTLAQWLEADGVDVRRLPKVAAHRSRMRSSRR